MHVIKFDFLFSLFFRNGGGGTDRPQASIIDITGLSVNEIWKHITDNKEQLARSTENPEVAINNILCFQGSPNHPFTQTTDFLYLKRNAYVLAKELQERFPDEVAKAILKGLPGAVFSEMNCFDGGGNSIIFSAQANGQRLVLRVPGGVDAWAGSWLMQTTAAATMFFPRIYGYFKCIISGLEGATKLGVTCMEELEHTNFERFTEKQKITNSMVFEFAWGEWIGRRLGGICIQDPDGPVFRNIGLRKVAQCRCYETPKGALYLFPPGLVPVQLDLDDVRHVKKGSEMMLRPLPFLATHIAPNASAGIALINHLNAINSGDMESKTAEELFKLYFAEFQISDTSQAPDGTIFFQAK